MEINLKKVQGLWHEKGLTPKTPRRAVRRGKSTTPLTKAEHPHHVWSIDFQYDVTRDGRVLKIVSMIDEFTRESLIDMVERSVNAAVARDSQPLRFKRQRWRPMGCFIIPSTAASTSISSSVFQGDR